LKLDHNVLNLSLEPADGICLLLRLEQSFGELEDLGLFVGTCDASVDRLPYVRNDPKVIAFTPAQWDFPVITYLIRESRLAERLGMRAASTFWSVFAMDASRDEALRPSSA
jgi:hypothetical protein